ncbi:competence type IV pilus major pilin ComGC [Sporosarcina highlanderae]|uniref:ComG operon protein 3 n=1 Tax=Sporosarcina highlanderae TaxID=3035916 RepID=A0ABT8JVR7_9BACL|nr:competence type IV pilus major pilin ComGC [Sporosarcina highlanderae]MDN4609027.1 competence type IV pilus major pilin ComGC [Sporosarcina highlanderae]
MKYLKGEKGFTLIEMMIVLLIISLLVLIALPNVTKHAEKIDEKGCDAYIQMVQGQVAAYRMDKHETPDLEDLVVGKYLLGEAKCPDNTKIKITEGVVERDIENAGEN